MSIRLRVEFDGGSRGNPGPAGYGAVVRDMDGTVLLARGGFVGKTTNNVAEYEGLIAALELAQSLNADEVLVHGDSQLVIRQMLGEYRVKNAGLKPLYERAKKIASTFKKVSFDHNYREQNELADKLANKAMDKKGDVSDDDV